MFEIEQGDIPTAVRDGVAVSVLNGGTMMHRRAIRKHLDTGVTERINWLMCELNGVRLYITEDNNIIMTTEDFNP